MVGHHHGGSPVSDGPTWADLGRAARAPGHPVVALAGNPNTGKSTLFNALTGLRQHTGNWPGKTVLLAQGVARHRGKSYTIVDLPGTYSLFASSVEESVASDFLCLARPDVTVVVADATCLERNLNLALQVIEVTDKVAVCLNLVDEARRKGCECDATMLEAELGVPVVATVATKGRGLGRLMDTVAGLDSGTITTRPKRVVYDPDVEEALAGIEPLVTRKLPPGAATRWLAVRALCGDMGALELVGDMSALELVDGTGGAVRKVTEGFGLGPAPSWPAARSTTSTAGGKSS